MWTKQTNTNSRKKNGALDCLGCSHQKSTVKGWKTHEDSLICFALCEPASRIITLNPFLSLKKRHLPSWAKIGVALEHGFDPQVCNKITCSECSESSECWEDMTECVTSVSLRVPAPLVSNAPVPDLAQESQQSVVTAVGNTWQNETIPLYKKIEENKTPTLVPDAFSQHNLASCLCHHRLGTLGTPTS